MVTKEKINYLLSTIKDYPDVTVVAAVKYFTIEETEFIIKSGINNIGENRKETFLEKYKAISNNDVTWHFFGALTSRSCYDSSFINKIDYLHTLESIDVAAALNKNLDEDKVIKCFVKVDVCDMKGRISPDKLVSFIKQLAKFPKIEVVGLMTIAKLTFDEEELAGYFKKMRELRDKVQALNLDYAPCKHLSMGMSNDYKIALEYGADFIRIGHMLG